jgi:hypothetical protein
MNALLLVGRCPDIALGQVCRKVLGCCESRRYQKRLQHMGGSAARGLRIVQFLVTESRVYLQKYLCLHRSSTGEQNEGEESKGMLTMTTIRFARPSLMYCAKASTVRAFKVCAGASASTILDSPLPIFARFPLPLDLPRPFSVSRHGLSCADCWR